MRQIQANVTQFNAAFLYCVKLLIMGRCSQLLTAFLLAGLSFGALADKAILVAEAVLVEINPEQPAPDDGEDIGGVTPPAQPAIGTATKATYITSGGWAVTSAEYIDVATMVFDFGGTTSVSGASLTMDVEDTFSADGSVPIEV
ncbi:MAG: hypothetical protein RLZZ385_886 [Pseudomonadota bacterium]